MNVLIFNSVSENIKRVINKKCGLNLSQTRLLLFFDHHQNETLTMGELKKVLAQIEAQIFSSWSEEKIQEFDSKLQLIVNNLVTDEV